MKLVSQEKLDIIQLRLPLNERLMEQLKQYVVYANTQLGHHFDTEKELAVEVFRAFLDGDRGFKQWLAKQNTTAPVGVPSKHKQRLEGAAFENGLSTK